MIYTVSGNQAYASNYKGKKLSILGASFDLPYPDYGVTIENIWWRKVCNALGMMVEKNNSISGSTVTGSTTGSTAGCGTRAQDLGTDPDIIMVTLGGNDFSAEVGIGTYDGSQTFPTSGSTFREAYALMLNKIMTQYPSAEVWCQTRPLIYETNGSIEFPEKNDNGVLLKTWNEAIADVATLFGAGIVRMEFCGMTWHNRQHFAGDYSSGRSLHPNGYGHSAMANEVIKTLYPACDVRFSLY